jgi:hypothetical protein
MSEVPLYPCSGCRVHLCRGQQGCPDFSNTVDWPRLVFILFIQSQRVDTRDISSTLWYLLKNTHPPDTARVLEFWVRVTQTSLASFTGVPRSKVNATLVGTA